LDDAAEGGRGGLSVQPLDRPPAEAAGERLLRSVTADVEAGVDLVGPGDLEPGHHLLIGLEAVPLAGRGARGELADVRFDGLERGLEAVVPLPGGLRTGPDGERPVRYLRSSIGT
jgi:hypothetical protein